MAQLNFNTPVADDRGLFATFWQRALAEINAASSEQVWTQSSNVTVIGGGAMTVSVLSIEFSYSKAKSVCFVDLCIGFTTGGAASPFIRVRLPHLFAGINTTFVPIAGYNTTGAAINIPLIATISPAVPFVINIFAGGNDVTDYSSGSAHQVCGTFSYHCQ